MPGKWPLYVRSSPSGAPRPVRRGVGAMPGRRRSIGPCRKRPQAVILTACRRHRRGERPRPTAAPGLRLQRAGATRTLASRPPSPRAPVRLPGECGRSFVRRAANGVPAPRILPCGEHHILRRMPPGSHRCMQQRAECHEAHLPAEQSPPQAEAWLPLPHAHPVGTGHHSPSAKQGTQAAERLSVSSASSFRAGSISVHLPSGPALARLRSSQDIERVFRTGTSSHSRSLSVHCLERPGDRTTTRAAVVAGRKVGGAVQRNRAKRRLRAALREVAIPPGVDVVIVARPRTADVAFADLRSTLSERLRTCARNARSS